jgi:hypothetical protein
VRYLASLIGTTNDETMRLFILVVVLLLTMPLFLCCWWLCDPVNVA